MAFPRTEEELAKAGFQYENTSQCTGPNCGKEIAWYRTPRGKKIPLDEGTLEPHCTTCPDAETFRRSK